MVLRALFVSSFLCFMTNDVGAQNYIGAERCQKCHAFEYRVWAESPHARAHKSLTQDQLKDAKCNTCHTVMSVESEQKLAGIQCERCHGPGKYYHPDYVMRDKELARAVGLVSIQPQHCAQCHTEGVPSIKPFDFVSMWAKIDHSKAAKADFETNKPTVTATRP